MMQDNRIGAVLNARSVAVVGASSDPLKITGRPIAYMNRLGFSGDLYPVNPARAEVQGLRSYPSLASIGRPVDLAVVGTASEHVAGVVEEGIAAGVRGFLIFSSGFAEHDDEGAARQARLSALAREAGVAIVGPNCLGVINAATGLVASFTTAMETHELRPGPFGFASQSGALGAYWLDMVLRERMGVSKWITTGNECDADVTSGLEYLVEDDATTVIGLYLEDIKQPERFRVAAQRAAALGKPIIAIKAGRSAAGAAAAASHTGALAGEDESYQALFDQYGIVRVRSLSEMVGLARVVLGGVGRSGARRAIMSVSGGAGVLIADELEEAALDLAAFSGETRSALRTALPAFSKPQNPIDLTATVVQDPRLFGQVLDVVMGAPEVDIAILFIGLMESISGHLGRAIGAARDRSGKPVVVIWIGAPPAVLETLRDNSVPVFEDIPPAIAALACADGLGARRETVIRLTAPLTAEPIDPATLSVWPEWRSKTWLAERSSLSVPPGTLIINPADTGDALAGLAGPFAAKLQARDMPHKSDQGGVRLKLADAGQATDAVNDLRALGERLGVAADGVLVEQMVAFDSEFLVGLRRDTRFGPMLVVGRGGIEVELTKDVKLGLLPLTAGEILGLLRSLRGAPLFEGFRGRAAVDLQAVADAISGLCTAFLQEPSVQEIEVNPLVAGPAGVWVLDALITAAAEPATA